MDEENKTHEPVKNYGKRPLWQWIVIYVVIAIVVYGLIYYMFIRDSGGTSIY